MPTFDLERVRSFWEANPLCASAIPYRLGTSDYFDCYDSLREANESPAFSERLHEYSAFRGRAVLDIGAGNGYVASRYARARARVYGIDLTRTGVDLCRQRFEREGLHGAFYVADAERLPFRDESFDCVCSTGVLHHTPRPEAAVAEIRRVLKTRGRLILMLYHRDSVLYRLTFPVLTVLTGKSRARLVNEVDGPGNPKGEVYSRGEARRLLAGFEDLEMFVGLLQPWMLPPVVRYLVPRGLLRKAEGRWGWFLYCKAVKSAGGRLGDEVRE